MPKTFYISLRNEASSNILELHFTDYIENGIDWSTWEEKNMVQDVINQVRAANPSKIKLLINSVGGDVMVGLPIYNYLKSLNIPIEAEVLGIAASIASVMAMAGNPVRMPKNSFLVMHAAWSGVLGNAAEMRQAADNLDKVSNQLADIYATKSGKHDAAYFTNLWAKGDVWLSAKEAEALGLVDEVTQEVAINNSIDFAAYGFKNIPKELQATEDTHKSFFQNFKEEMGNILNSLKAALSGAKEKETKEVFVTKDEIIEFMQSALTPFAESVEQEIEKRVHEVPAGDAKPIEEEVEVDPQTGNPKTTPVGPEKEPVEPKPVPPLPAEANDIAALKDELKTLRDQVANMSTKPATAKHNAIGSLANKITVEYQD